MQALIGTGIALITPFKKDFSVDVAALEKITQEAINNNIDYLVIMGTTAENATLTPEEIDVVIKTVIAVNNRKLPLVLGIGGNNTAKVIHELQTTNLEAFSAILSVCPYYNKPTQEGIYQHFSAIAQASPLPILLYNVPSRTGVGIQVATVVKLAESFKNIIGIKEASGDMVQAMQLLKDCPKDFLIISGDDMIALPMVLAGGAGVISVIAQAFPEKFSKMIQLGLQQKNKEAYELHYQFMEGIDLIFEQGNPAGIKEMLEALKISSNVLRLPLVSVDSILKNKINEYVRSFPC